MATKNKSIDDFLAEQKNNSIYYVITQSNILTSVFVYPYNLANGIMTNLKISIPKDVILSITPIGLTTEMEMKIYNIVTIKFTSDIGRIYESIFEELINNSVSIHQPSEKSASVDLENIYKPMRDWCGWHWPTK